MIHTTQSGVRYATRAASWVGRQFTREGIPNKEERGLLMETEEPCISEPMLRHGLLRLEEIGYIRGVVQAQQVAIHVLFDLV